MPDLIFINYNASHRRNTNRDVQVINTHIAKQVHGHDQPDGSYERDDAIYLQSSSLDCRIGGFRTEPFGILPVENRGLVAVGFDYYTQVYAPLALQLGTIGQLQTHTSMINLLHEPMYFDSMIALMLVMQNLQVNMKERTSVAVSYHSNKAITQLREKISSPTEMFSDLVIMTICVLAVLPRLSCDYTAYDAHVNGVRRIVSARGGLDQLGWHGLIKIAVIGMFESWDALQLQKYQSLRNRQSSTAQTCSGSTNPSPSLPAIRIPLFPAGFRKLALTDQLSLPTLSFLDLLFSWLPCHPRSPSSITELTHEILSTSSLSVTEGLLAITLQAYLNYLERTERRWSNAATEHSVRYLIQGLDPTRCAAECDEDVLRWSCLMLSAATAKGSDANRWARRMLSRTMISEQKRTELAENFLPIPGPEAE